MRPRAVIVADLGFGDAGKGLVTDFLVRRLGARTVVRYNGGPQAGHNVLTSDGRHHTFSQFGAGSFVPGTRTYLSRFMAVHPTALLVEARRLAQAGAPDALDRLYVCAQALVITPFHQAAARLRELARGRGRHGSCGTGFGEAVGDARSGRALRVAQLSDRRAMRRALEEQRLRKKAELAAEIAAAGPAGEAERGVLEDTGLSESWIEAVQEARRRFHVVDDGALGEWLAEGPVVFEGAQGVLLDEWHGFHPHTTWSTCTFDNALALLDERGFSGAIERLGVLRTYLVRHGPGPFPTEDSALSARAEPHNADGPWQGPFRAGWPDWALLKYAIAACRGVDGLAATHLDALDGRDRWRAAVGYGPSVSVEPSFDRDLSRQEALTRALLGAAPVYRELGPGADLGERFLAALEEAAGVPVRLASRGPCADRILERALGVQA